MSPLVTPLWIAERRANPNLRIADASWYLPQVGRNAKAEYAAGHIPGAVFFDIDALSDETSPWPHMLPPPDKFARAMGELGIGDETMLVVYDGAGLYSAPRAWWMLRAMGHDKVVILDGGLPAWNRAGYPVVDRPTTVLPGEVHRETQSRLAPRFHADDRHRPGTDGAGYRCARCTPISCAGTRAAAGCTRRAHARCHQPAL